MTSYREIYRRVLAGLYTEEQVTPPSMKWKTVTIDEYLAIYEKSTIDPFRFWEYQAKNLIWHAQWSELFDGVPPRTRWFIGGKISPYYNIIGKHKDTWIWDKPALIWEGEEENSLIVTYKDLDELVDRIAYALSSEEVKSGEWIIIYAPPIVETIAVALASIKIGIPFEPVFTGFGSWELAKRIRNRKARLLFTVDGFPRRGRVIDVLDKARRAVDMLGGKIKIIVANRLSAPSLRENEVLFDDYISVNKRVESLVVNSDHLLFGLHSAYRDDYKPIAHSTGGYLVQVHSTSRWIGIKPHDTYYCSVWPGWITNTSYVMIGPLMIGSTIVLYDGGPDYPSWGRWLKLIEDYSVTLFLTTSMALRLISRNVSDKVLEYNLDTLRAILVTAEPLDTETWWWTYRYLGTGKRMLIDSNPRALSGRIPVVNLYIQSEVGTFITGNLVDYTFPPIRPGSAGPPIPGFDLRVLGENGELTFDGEGELVIRNPWPSMPIEYPREYEEAWSSGYYKTRDYAYISRDRYVYVAGRIDGVYKSSGFRISPGSISLFLQRYNIISRVIPCMDRDRYQDVIIVHSRRLDNELSALIRDELGAIQTPRLFIETNKDSMEKLTRSKAFILLDQCKEESLRSIALDILSDDND